MERDFFPVLRAFRRNGNLQAIKNLLTPETVHYRDFEMRGVVWHICSWSGANAELLDHAFEQGASSEMAEKDFGPLHCLAHNNFSSFSQNALKCARILIDRCALIDTSLVDGKNPTFVKTPLQRALDVCFDEMAVLLLDAGAKLEHLRGSIENTPKIRFEWAYKFAAAREKTRIGCIAVLGLQESNAATLGRNNGKDVLRMIARCLWATRGIYGNCGE